MTEYISGHDLPKYFLIWDKDRRKMIRDGIAVKQKGSPYYLFRLDYLKEHFQSRKT